jgi:hypothetical protein
MRALDRQFFIADDGRTIFSTTRSGRQAFFIPDAERVTAWWHRTIAMAATALLCAAALVSYLVRPTAFSLWVVLLAGAFYFGLVEMRRWAGRFPRVTDPRLIQQLARAALAREEPREVLVAIAVSIFLMSNAITELVSVGAARPATIAYLAVAVGTIGMAVKRLLDRRALFDGRARDAEPFRG